MDTQENTLFDWNVAVHKNDLNKTKNTLWLSHASQAGQFVWCYFKLFIVVKSE